MMRDLGWGLIIATFLFMAIPMLALFSKPSIILSDTTFFVLFVLAPITCGVALILFARRKSVQNSKKSSGNRD